ncbi:hypothetical protein LEP1GSC103_3265 [Leptospira borgpetersenii serovar Javanica str. UI 09931]|uniref:Uncharacterized protein n=5 Tax=Leptospira borgpetersenii TaxID=174 RepID=M3GSZ3_LEPBO|nr:hypothetical protein LBBP_02154 [Leptospira borgpetersenii serovar Ballum]EKP14209.1 hypothetical protein LEP1GSC128_2818 [Leptospira borgpetersenii str. 200801926]EKQ90756.1 hypothetical protein LEP1GSC101_0703 [Leptospira borgpetersenii str. UI 09149]EKR00149.1 hypothetical protein LEP1GSC121_3752 [Leptospira borgpetersenii serovar Castellonis str. 200801910]EMF97953.1 hypothetical protein LEP1GSC123_4114 [Leptospira borgpetersenii str. 200701203]EMK14792.1 hypothetical protein LEP1GSC066
MKKNAIRHLPFRKGSKFIFLNILTRNLFRRTIKNDFKIGSTAAHSNFQKCSFRF